MKLFEMVGLKISAVKSFRSDMRKKKGFVPRYILFDDNKTYIELEEQDYYAYHDCSSFAKEITITQDEKRWKQLMEDNKHYPNADMEI